MDWIAAATRWREWTDRDEPGRVAAYLDSLIEDGVTWVEGGNIIDIHTATVASIDAAYWGLEKELFLESHMAFCSLPQLQELKFNIHDRLLRMHPIIRCVSSGYRVAKGEYPYVLYDNVLEWNINIGTWSSSLCLAEGQNQSHAIFRMMEDVAERCNPNSRVDFFRETDSPGIRRLKSTLHVYVKYARPPEKYPWIYDFMFNTVSQSALRSYNNASTL